MVFGMKTFAQKELERKGKSYGADRRKAFFEGYDLGKKEGAVALAKWIDGNCGASSEALYLYMTLGRKPMSFDAPSDSHDRGRCVVLLQAMPEWIPRLSEIEALKIEGTCNGIRVTPWNEQIPLIRTAIEGGKI